MSIYWGSLQHSHHHCGYGPPFTYYVVHILTDTSGQHRHQKWPLNVVVLYAIWIVEPEQLWNLENLEYLRAIPIWTHLLWAYLLSTAAFSEFCRLHILSPSDQAYFLQLLNLQKYFFKDFNIDNVTLLLTLWCLL